MYIPAMIYVFLRPYLNNFWVDYSGWKECKVWCEYILYWKPTGDLPKFIYESSSS